jgi:predicted acylesterase/phospholipase RssA
VRPGPAAPVRLAPALALVLVLAAPPFGAPNGAAAQAVPARGAVSPSGGGGPALVLSTGASRGFAHTGVLVGLDSLGFDPDIVVGTSMGAVVGALYAAGYTPQEIWGMVQAIDWGDVFMPAQVVLGPTRQALAPALVLGLSPASFEVSRGFVSDWRVNRLMVRLLFEASAAIRGDFDRLPRRYRAVVADLSTGEALALASGDLPRAVRISMGAPAFFAPLDWDGRLLTDGGIANYLPISVARELGGSPIVAVDVSRPHPRIRSRDPAALAVRALGLMMRNAVPDTVADVLIEPAIDPDFSGAFFPADAAPLYRVGLDGALETGLRFDGARKERRLPPPPESLVALRIEVPDARLERWVRRAFEDLAPGPYLPEQILERVDRLYATGLVTGVWPRVESAAGGDVLVVRAEVVPRSSLALAPGYDNDRGGRMWAALQQRLRGASLPMDFTLAASMNGLERWGEISLRGYAPRRPLAGVLAVYGRQSGVRILQPDSLPGEQNVWRAGAWAGTEMRRVFPDWLATLGVHGEHIHEVDGDAGFAFGPSLRFARPGESGLVVGVPSALRAELRLGEFSYGAVGVRSSRAFALPGLVAAAVIEVEATVGDAPIDARPALGDGRAMPGLSWGAERGKARGVVGLDVGLPTVMNGFLRTRLRAGTAPSALEEIGELDRWVAGVALEGVWGMPFGPVLVGGGINTRGHHRLDVSLGMVF